MVSRREAALPHPHHLELAEAIVENVRRNLDRLGRMRGLTVVRVGASGGIRIDVVPAVDVRLGLLDDLGIAAIEAIAVIDDVLTYDPESEAAMLVVETNPVDGVLLTFLIQDVAGVR